VHQLVNKKTLIISRCTVCVCEEKVGMYFQWCHKRDRTLSRPVCHGNVRLFKMWKHTYKTLTSETMTVLFQTADLLTCIWRYLIRNWTGKLPGLTECLCFLYVIQGTCLCILLLRKRQIPFICFSIYYVLIIQQILYIIHKNIYKLIEA
jgi:hypothetical protein